MLDLGHLTENLYLACTALRLSVTTTGGFFDDLATEWYRMNPIIYRLLYRLTRPPWDTGITPPEVVATFAEGDLPPGPALDLGCGTGTNVI